MSRANALGASHFRLCACSSRSSGPSQWWCFLTAAYLIIVAVPGLTLAVDSDVVVDAVARSGSRVIRSAEFRFQLNIQDQIPSDAEIREMVDRVKQANREMMAKYSDNPMIVKRLQNAIDRVDEEMPPQLIQNASLQFRGYFASSGPELGGDRYYEFSQLDRVKEQYGATRMLLLRSNGPAQGIGID